jgi:hypothetical protein
VLTSLARSPLRLGFMIGLLFGSWNVMYSWLFPVADDTPTALLAFYGPMFAAWAAAAFIATHRTGRVSTGMITGAVVAFATFFVYNLLVILRVNLFLDELTRRSDWENLMVRFQTSGYQSLRTFVNVENVKGAPLKVGVASCIGAVMGLVGGVVGRLAHGRRVSTV